MRLGDYCWPVELSAYLSIERQQCIQFIRRERFFSFFFAMPFFMLIGIVFPIANMPTAIQ